MFLRLLGSLLRPSRSSSRRLVKRALELRGAGRLAESEELLRSGVERYPGDADVATNLAVVLLEQDKMEGIDWLERALHRDPRFAPAHYNYANVLRANGRLAEAIEHYRTAKTSDPQFASAPEELMQTLLEVCDWDGAREIADELRNRVASRPATEWMRFVSPLTAIYLGLDPEQCKEVAAFHAPRPFPITTKANNRNGDRIRIAYFSRDFRDHPVGHLLRSIFALHDRQRFEIHAYSFGVDDASVYRRAIEQSVDHFVDVSAKTDAEAAQAISRAGIEVLVDLMGHTTGNRMGVLARRPAPVQTHYLGYAGTTGASYMDFFLSDEVVTPRELRGHFTEEVAYVPGCFMVSDGTDALAAPRATRVEQQLPEDAYVFSNFGNPSRITREVFRLWMEILKGVPESILWLRRSDALVVQNLRHEAGMAGIAPHRLLFAQRVPDKAAHFGRLALSDLALDTIGWYNGHSSTADMLWAGVPVLTAPGATFASRVAASLVCAAGIPELVVQNDRDYVATAIRLSNDRRESSALRKKLEAARASAPFFDAADLVRGLETAYSDMYAGKIRRPAGL